MLAALASDTVIDAAYLWLCHQRRHWPADADIWDFRFQGGLYRDCERSISRGCPLSPLLGAFFLHELDVEMSRHDVFYIRFMDDILILAPTRWKLRRAVKSVNARFDSLGLEKHPDKTFIGRIERGFDFLGYHLSRKPLRLAVKTIQQFRTRLHRLYEQQNKASEDALSVVKYVTRWVRWARAGFNGLGRLHVTAVFARIADTGQAKPK